MRRQYKWSLLNTIKLIYTELWNFSSVQKLTYPFKECTIFCIGLGRAQAFTEMAVRTYYYYVSDRIIG